eukprot:TRINITY_DN19808_c1_g1_i1.p1 TRINITY_DN19808_c1_g1~~TRINITY_DN19808_c1_g1_i1.p1  ORF type:complete len:384 (+),score=78.88 TRINITY_DN19808_c1_g1_i1:23-1153(+)
MSLCAPTDSDDVTGRLNYACQMGHTSYVKQVVEECKVTNFDMLDQYGSPPLYNAALKNDNAELIKYLLKNGATVELKNADNETPFFIAVFNNHIEVSKLLLEHGAKTDLKGGVYGDYPMHVACRNNLSTMLNLLISHKANLNCRNDLGETPLFIACKQNRFNLAYTLLMNKANKNLSSEGKDCLYIASEKKHLGIIQLLKASGPAELMKVKQSQQVTKSKTTKKKETWQEIEFNRKLEQLGVSAEEAARKPRETPVSTYRVKKPSNRPRHLYESDEEEDAASKPADQSVPQQPRTVYRDPAGTTYNPTGAAHIKDIQNSKEAFKNYKPPPRSNVKPPPPGFIDHQEEQAPAAPQLQHSPSPPRRSKSGQSRRKTVK